MIDLSAAAATLAALQAADALITDEVVEQIRLQLAAMLHDWSEAVDALHEFDGAWVELAGAITPGMVVLFPTQDGDWKMVERQTVNGSLQLVNGEYGKPLYLSYATRATPIVVRRRKGRAA